MLSEFEVLADERAAQKTSCQWVTALLGLAGAGAQAGAGIEGANAAAKLQGKPLNASFIEEPQNKALRSYFTRETAANATRSPYSWAQFLNSGGQAGSNFYDTGLSPGEFKDLGFTSGYGERRPFVTDLSQPELTPEQSLFYGMQDARAGKQSPYAAAYRTRQRAAAMAQFLQQHAGQHGYGYLDDQQALNKRKSAALLAHQYNNKY